MEPLLPQQKAIQAELDGDADSSYTNQDPDLKPKPELTAEQKLYEMQMVTARGFGMLMALLDMGHIPRHLRDQAIEIKEAYEDVSPTPEAE